MPAPLKSPLANSPEIELPELSLRVEAAANFAHFAKILTNKKETKTIKCRTKVGALLSLAVKLCPNHSPSSSALPGTYSTPLLTPFATLFRCTQRLFSAEAGAKSCSRSSTCCSARFRLFWLLCVIAAACGMRHTVCVFCPTTF